MPDKKKVVYLIGTGASHAELQFQDTANHGILMPDVAKGVLDTLQEANEQDFSIKELLNLIDTGKEEAYPNIDIEGIITLYEAAGTATDKLRANKLKKLFRKVISDRIKKAVKADEDYPKLLSALIDMHSIKDNDEELTAIITINYDDFIEKAFFKTFGELNYPFEIASDSNAYKLNRHLPPLCKLHGSFNWENSNPVKINDNLIDDDEDTVLWVPPGVIKRNDYYPFNAIWGKARERLKCDVLRVIGCSLSRNDWSLISLLHVTNRLRADQIKYEIQYIDYPSACDQIYQNFPYLDSVKNITSLTEFDSYMQSEYREDYEIEDGDDRSMKICKWMDKNKGKFNVFEEWLKSKGHNLTIDKGIKLETNSHIFETFYFG
jgi:hypothetical protein